VTLCIAVKCEDGVLVASDSRTVYHRGVPISRDINKIHIIEKKGLVQGKLAIVGAGTVTFIDKFIRMFLDTNLEKVAKEELNKSELSLSEVMSKVAEPLIRIIYDEYVERRKIDYYTCDLIIAGYETPLRADAFVLYGIGLAEPVNDFSAIGSGAAYAELFLRHLLPQQRKVESVIKPVCYTIRLVGTIDPFVGGKLNLVAATPQGIEDISESAVELPEPRAREVLSSVMKNLKELLEGVGGGDE
jgi:20S proteasome alpha/beta subunit